MVQGAGGALELLRGFGRLATTISPGPVPLVSNCWYERAESGSGFSISSHLAEFREADLRGEPAG